jgi:3-methyladenine DNA glycosylase AlkD
MDLEAPSPHHAPMPRPPPPALTWSPRRVRAELERLAVPAKAPQMQAYMKSSLPFHGVAKPVLQACVKGLVGDAWFESGEALDAAVRAQWASARFREERYVALELLAHRRARPLMTLARLPLLEALIVAGAWWDLVDPLAGRVEAVLVAEPGPTAKAMRQWSRCDDLWKRRASIICQLHRKADTDVALLFECVEPSLDSKEFFLRKGIGWALRALSATDPEAVRRFVTKYDGCLSGLSRREALRGVERALA